MVDWFQQWCRAPFYGEHFHWWKIVGYAAVWTLWLARNEAVFEKKVWQLDDIFELIKLRSFHWTKASNSKFEYSYMDWCDSPWKLKRMHSDLVNRTRLLNVWEAPMPGCLKFNVDGSAWGKPGLAGCGGILRDESKKVVGMFFGPLGIIESNEAEVKAIQQALVLFLQTKWVGVKELVIESDSMVAVLWVKNVGSRPWKLWKVFNEIDNCINVIKKVSFFNIYREANAFADSLAKMGVRKHSLFQAWWDVV